MDVMSDNWGNSLIPRRTKVLPGATGEAAASYDDFDEKNQWNF